MANNISNRMSLDGGDDIRKQMLAIGDAGEQLFRGLKALADQFGRIDASQLDQVRPKLQQTSAAVAETNARFGELGGQFGKVGSAATTTTASVNETGTSLLGYATKIGVAVGALALAASAIISSIAKAAADTTSQLQTSATKFGLTTEAYQRLAKVADDANLSVDSFNKILGDIDRASTAAAGSIQRIIPSGTIGAFQNVRDVIGKISDEALPKLAGGLAIAKESASGTIDLIQKFGDKTVTVINGVSKAAFDLGKVGDNIRGPAHAAAGALAELGLSAEILGKLDTAQRLQLIAAQLDKLPDSAAKASLATKLLGADWRNNIEFFKQGADALRDGAEGARTFTDAEIKSGKGLKDALDDLGKAFSFAKDKIGLLFAPGQTARAEWLTGLIDDARKLVFGFIEADDAKKKLLASGTFDFFKDFDLEKFQAFLSQKGETGLATAIGLIRDVAADLARVWTSVLIPAGKLVIAAFDGIASAINSTFGTDISGRFVAIVAAIGLVSGAFGLFGAVLGPIGTLIGFMLSSFATLGPLLLGAGLAVRTFWTEFRLGGTAAITAGRSEQAGFISAFAALARGSFAEAWALFKTSALNAFTAVKEALTTLFGASGSTFTAIRSLISGVALAAAGLAAIFNSIFGTNIGIGGLLLVAVLTQMTIGFRTLAIAGQLLAALFTPIGAGIAAVIASGIILARVFPDIGKSWLLVTQAFDNLLRGDFAKAFDQLGEAFDGVWTNLKNQGVLTWTILGAGAIAVTAAVAGIIEKVRALGAMLLVVSPVLAGLASAGIIASDITRSLGPVEEFENKVTALNAQFRDGKISAAEYDKQMKALHNSFGQAKTDSVSTTESFGDAWKTALAKIGEAMRGAASTSTDSASKVAGPWKEAAERVAGGFKETSKGIWEPITQGSKPAADQVVKDFKSAADAVQTGFKQIAPGIWEKIPQDAKAAAQATDDIWKGIAEAVSTSLDTAQKAFDALKTQGVDAATAIKQSFDGLKNTQLPDWLKNLGPLPGTAAGPGANPFGDKLGAAATDARALTDATNEADAAMNQLGAEAEAALDGLKADQITVATGFGTLTTDAGTLAEAYGGVASAFTSGSADMVNSLDQVIARLQTAAAVARALEQANIGSQSAGSTGDGSAAEGFAGGGVVRGPGTGTSDSIIARVSRGELIVQAEAVRALVRRFGSGIVHAINNFHRIGELPGFSMGGLVEGVTRQLTSLELPGFAAGGVVNFSPALAGAGHQSLLHPVTIDLGGGRVVGGLLASPDVVQALKRESVLDRIAKSGRSPSRGRS
jgi:hypothetical protein